MDNTPNVPSAPSVSAVEGGNVEAVIVEKFNKETGRQFKTVDDAVKSMKDTFDFVAKLGDVKEKATKYDEMVKSKPSTSSDERVDKLEFIYKHPEAKDVVEDVAAIAKTKGTTYETAYESSFLKKYVESEVEKQKGNAPMYVSPNQRIDANKGPISVEDFKKLTPEEQRKIVTQLPSWGRKV